MEPKSVALYLLTLAFLCVCALILYPFLPAITGALALAIITHQPYIWLRKKIGNHTVAATTALLIVMMGIIGPISLLLQSLTRNALLGAQSIQDGRIQQGVNALVGRFPQIAIALGNSSEILDLEGAAKNLAQFLIAHMAGMLAGSVATITQTIIMLFLLFFLYRDEELAFAMLRHLMPLTEEESSAVEQRVIETIRATVLGRLLVAAVQGLVAGVTFWALGLRPAILLGLLTACLSLLPAFGAYLVWLPLCIWLASTGHWIKMALLLGIGTLIISTLDNFLYPALVGSKLRQHTATVFLALLGGVWFFGIPGLVLGPVAFSITTALLAICKMRSKGGSYSKASDNLEIGLSS